MSSDHDQSSQLPLIAADFMANRHRTMAYINGLVNDAQHAEDIFQEVWIRVAQALEERRSIENLEAWTRGVAKNLILHYWRKNKRTQIVFDDELLDLATMAFEENHEQIENWKSRKVLLNECVNRLPEKSKSLLHLKYHIGYKVAEIASSLGGTSSGIMMSLSRIRKGLKKCVETKLTDLSKSS